MVDVIKSKEHQLKNIYIYNFIQLIFIFHSRNYDERKREKEEERKNFIRRIKREILNVT